MFAPQLGGILTGAGLPPEAVAGLSHIPPLGFLSGWEGVIAQFSAETLASGAPQQAVDGAVAALTGSQGAIQGSAGVSLGSGFRGGLFFATLFMGALGGRLYAAAVDLVWPGLELDPNVYAVIGMSALSASVIGGPLTMSFIALESTGNLWLTSVVLVAVMISTQITRELFGYSFATWRLHLRGETIRSAADVGWIRDLTVGRLMRADVATVDAGIGIDEFRTRFPLGSKAQVVAIDATGRYLGLAVVAEAHAPDIDAKRGLIGILHHRDVVLHPAMNIQEAIAVFDAAEAESLAVVEAGGEYRPVGILSEAHAMRRYAEESDKRRREAIGEV